MAGKWYDKALNKIGLHRMRSASAAIAPGTETYQTLWDWINSPMKSSQTIDWELRSKLRRMRQDARQLAVNNPIIRQYLALLKQNVIGPRGMRLQSQVRNNDGNLNKNINDKIEAAFNDFWKSPWVDKRMTGLQGEHLLLQTLAVDGEIFVRRIIGSRFKYGFALQMIDADQVDHTLNQPRSTGGPNGTGNEIRLGVEVDEFSAPVAYWLWDGLPQDLNNPTPANRIRVAASEMIHLFDPERIAQTRGISWLNSIATSVSILDGYVEASLVAARTAACAFPLFKHTNTLSDPENPQNFNIELNPGKGMTIPEGLDMVPWDPKQPTQNFGEFTKDGKRWIASGLHVSYNALANDLEGVNYSSMRSGLLIERDWWRCLQQTWIDRIKSPVHTWFLQYALLSGDLVLDSRDPRKFQSAKWTSRGWAWVDPLKDVNAAVISIENGLGSRSRYLGEQGEDFEEVCEEQQDEKRIAAAAGLDFSAAAVTAKDVLNQTETEETVTGDQGTGNGKDKKTSAALRREMLNFLIDDEDFDTQRTQKLMNLYRKGA